MTNAEALAGFFALLPGLLVLLAGLRMRRKGNKNTSAVIFMAAILILAWLPGRLS